MSDYVVVIRFASIFQARDGAASENTRRGSGDRRGPFAALRSLPPREVCLFVQRAQNYCRWGEGAWSSIWIRSPVARPPDVAASAACATCRTATLLSHWRIPSRQVTFVGMVTAFNADSRVGDNRGFDGDGTNAWGALERGIFQFGVVVSSFAAR